MTINKTMFLNLNNIINASYENWYIKSKNTKGKSDVFHKRLNQVIAMAKDNKNLSYFVINMKKKIDSYLEQIISDDIEEIILLWNRKKKGKSKTETSDHQKQIFKIYGVIHKYVVDVLAKKIANPSYLEIVPYHSKSHLRQEILTKFESRKDISSKIDEIIKELK